MKYDFTTVPDRRGMDAIAVDNPPGLPKEGFDLIPMWVADMNFPACPTIPETIIQRTRHTTYGYFSPPAGILRQHHPLAQGAQRCGRSEAGTHRLCQRRAGRCHQCHECSLLQG